MTYTPNFSDPRVKRKVKKALGFVRSCFSETTPHPWSTRYIDQHFGQSTTDISRWLRAQLLINTNPWWSMDHGKCKEYTLNRRGFDQVVELLQSDNVATINVCDLPVQWAQSEFKDQLATKVFSYTDINNRLWHPLQNVRKVYKREILASADLRYQYDIQCCAPTLIMQHAQQQEDPMDVIPEYIDAYLKDRTTIRYEISQRVELDPSAIKVLVNSFFAGAKLGNNPTFATYKMLEGDLARIDYLKQDPFICGLRKDIKMCWDYIKPDMPRTSVINKNNKQQLLPLSSKAKWFRYFFLERQVLDSVRDYLNLNDIQFFAEHDGWTTDKEVDQVALITHVVQMTGYKIKLDLDIIQ
jgi:hypothetical protein